MKDIHENDEKNEYYFEDPSNIGIPTLITFSMICLVYSYTLVTGRNDIHEDDFPDHVKQMHQDRDRKFELEYKVSHNYTLITFIAICFCQSM